ncbi:putative Abi (CAAX) family protease [Salirhabdus euzebyi]|uniref:Putative Abi (CAAX) family protease n=1 Tax=Salirhabdus euzebyi TaxID=394506 RepID=A0A841PTE7_9BACI|nr:YtpI family protein [Salirhabdus euzebyi]MBB6452099.1 putative Abi (CAAX) family protease [Salirhabdus euzebyi]
MIIFPIIIVLAIVMYIYFKVKILTLKEPILMQLTNAKARIALGIFIFFFGINQYLFYETSLALFIGIVFLLIGVMQAQYGFKLYKFFRKEVQNSVVTE